MLYIRHGEKAYSNGKSRSYPLDPPLTKKGKIAAIDRFTYLLVTYGCPEVIICSPFLRTRETAYIAASAILNNSNIVIPVICSNTISEYLGNQIELLPNSIREETMEYKPILLESWKQFKDRAKVENIPNIGRTWYISHGLTIQHIAKSLGKEMPYPKVLTGFSLIDGEIVVV